MINFQDFCCRKSCRGSLWGLGVIYVMTPCPTVKSLMMWGGGFTKNRDTEKSYPQLTQLTWLNPLNFLGMTNIFVGKRTYSKFFRVKT